MVATGAGGGALPGLGDDDIVEGGVAFAEAGEADFEHHCWVGGDGWLGVEIWGGIGRAEGGMFFFFHGTCPALGILIGQVLF